MKKMLALIVVAGVMLSGALAPMANASPAASPDAASDGKARGAVTNLPIPRYVSMKAASGNVRRGPSLTHRIDWVFQRRNMPLEVVAEYDNWRRVQDRDGLGGWVHYSLLSGERTVIVEPDILTLRRTPETNAPVTAELEAGVVAFLDQCRIDWCRVNASGYKGWAKKTALWGVDPEEILE